MLPRELPNAPLGTIIPGPAKVADPSRVAVLLNRNAKRVTDRIARKMEKVVGRDNLFYSRSLEEAEELSRQIVQRGYGTIVCGGGDGTLVQAVNQIHRYVEESNAWRVERGQRTGEEQRFLTPPRFAFLRLGTGNALSSLVGARNPVKDLRQIVDLVPGRTLELPLMRWGAERFFFCGMGYDAMVLNDYNSLKERTHNRLLKPLLHGVSGYFAALLARTLPRVAFSRSHQLEARVKTIGRGYYVDPRRGDFIAKLEPGTVVFEGKASFIGAGTVPYFGYQFRVFPFARMMPELMNLRITTMGAAKTLANLPKIWKGTYRNSESILDFMVDGYEVELARPFPFQHSGDAAGEVDELKVTLAAQPIELVDLYPKPPLA